MEGTAGADGTDVTCTGGRGWEASIISITMQHNCLYLSFTACQVMIVLLL